MTHIITHDSFYLPAGPTGVLLLHGFVGNPTELRGLGEALHRQGCTVYAPLLAGHGGPPDGLAGVRWRDWLASAEQALDTLTGRMERVVVVGFSMGGTLATLLAQREGVAGLVTLAAMLRMDDGRIAWLPLAQRVIPWWYPYRNADFDDPAVQAQIRTFAPDVNLMDPQVRRALVTEVRIPTGAVAELAQLVRYARKRVPFIHVPALVMHGRLDDVANPADAHLMYGLLNSRDKRQLWFERSGHQLVNDVEREAVWAAVGQFVAEVSGSPSQVA